MNYLITGHKGFIGSNLVPYLLSKGENVTGLDYFDCDLCNGFPASFWESKLDVIVHLAAETDVRASINHPVRTILRNTKSTINMIELARAREAKLIFASSCGARYAQSPYTASKLACEAICTAYKKSYNADIIILRFPNIYGPHSSHKPSIITKLIKSKLLGREVTIYGDGRQTRNFLYITDLCKAIYTADKDLELTTGELTSINELVEMLGCKPTYKGAIAGEITTVSSARNIIPDYSLDQGLNETIKWFKDFYEIR